MWIAWSVPLMVIGVGIAVLPVVLGSVHHQRVEEGVRQRRVRRGRESVTPSIVTRAADWELSVATTCPVCGERIVADSDELLVEAAERHAWLTHGIPSPSQVVNSARSV